jgi:7-dehydrocholesterol reductase
MSLAAARVSSPPRPAPRRPERWTVPAAGGALVGAPLLVVWAWLACRDHGGALSGPVRALLDDPLGLVAALPRPTLTGFVLLAAWYLIQAALMLWLPGRRVLGAVSPAGHRLEYRVNGLLAWLVVHLAAFVVAFHWRLLPPTLVHDHWGGLLVAANVAGLLAALAVWIKAHVAPTHAADRRFTGSLVHDFYAGIELNPRLGPLDLKLFHIGRIGMLAWTLINASFAARQYETLGYLTTSMLVLLVLQTLYVVDLFAREEWYLHTTDIQHDRFGFYLAWGGVVWLPFMYTLPAAYLAATRVDLSPVAVLAVLALGLAGYGLFLSANRQRSRFRATGGRAPVWGAPPRAIPARYVTADGQVHDTALLASGWWGLARHPNYIGDIMMALAFSLTCGFDHLLPYFYAIYLPALLVHRALRDERRCRDKYGAAWDAYCAAVPWRIVPGVW